MLVTCGDGDASQMSVSCCLLLPAEGLPFLLAICAAGLSGMACRSYWMWVLEMDTSHLQLRREAMM